MRIIEAGISYFVVNVFLLDKQNSNIGSFPVKSPMLRLEKSFVAEIFQSVLKKITLFVCVTLRDGGWGGGSKIMKLSVT